MQIEERNLLYQHNSSTITLLCSYLHSLTFNVQIPGRRVSINGDKRNILLNVSFLPSVKKSSISTYKPSSNASIHSPLKTGHLKKISTYHFQVYLSTFGTYPFLIYTWMLVTGKEQFLNHFSNQKVTRNVSCLQAHYYSYTYVEVC